VSLDPAPEVFAGHGASIRATTDAYPLRRRYSEREMDGD
jgi:hypothetical protein